MDKDVTDVSIPASLYKKIEDTIKGTEFSSVADYVTKALREKLSQAAGPDDGFTKEDEEKVKERLKALGYID